MALSRGQILNQPVVSDPDQILGGSITLRDTSGTPVDITITAPATVSTGYTFTLPDAPPAVSGYILSFTTAGVASFVENTPTPGGTVEGAIQYRTSGGTQAGADYALYNPGNQSIDLVYNTTTPTPLRWLDTASTNFAAFQAPADITRDYTVDLPALIPGTTGTTDAVGYVLKIASHSDQSSPGETTAVLEWGPPLTGSNVSQGPAGNIQTSDNTGGFEDKTAGNYLIYSSNTLNFQNTAGAIQINGGLLLNSSTLGSTVTDSSLTTVGILQGNTTSGATGVEVSNTVESAADLILNAGGAGVGSVIIKGESGTGVGRVEIQDQQVAVNSITIDVPGNIGTSYTLTLPPSVTDSSSSALQLDSGYNATLVDNRRTLNFCMDGGGVTALSIGPKGFMRISGDYTIEEIILLTESADTMTVAVNQYTYANFPASPSLIDTISTTASNKVTRTTADFGVQTINATSGDIIDFEITGGTTPFTSVFATISITLRPNSKT